MRDNIRRRNAAVDKRYNEEYEKGFRDDIIYRTLADEFFLSESTIYAILSGHYDRIEARRLAKLLPQKDPNQLEFFEQKENSHEQVQN